MYDIILDRQLVEIQKIVPNQKMPFIIDDELKLDIEKQKDRDRVVVWMIDIDEDAVPIGFNYVGKFYDDSKRKWRHKIEVFYFNKRIDWANKLKEDELKRRKK